jgi:hypothetical protein
MLYGTAYRAVVVHSSVQDKRRQQRLERDTQASYSPKFRQALGTSICFGKRTKKLIGLLLPTR